jgi:hypothetical protein
VNSAAFAVAARRAGLAPTRTPSPLPHEAAHPS